MESPPSVLPTTGGWGFFIPFAPQGRYLTLGATPSSQPFLTTGEEIFSNSYKAQAHTEPDWGEWSQAQQARHLRFHPVEPLP